MLLAKSAALLCLSCLRCQGFMSPRAPAWRSKASTTGRSCSAVARTLSMSDAVASPPCKVVSGTERLLWLDNLSNTYDGVRHQFKGIDLVVCRGQKLGVVGVNGCGKSTLLKVIAGIEDPDSGKVNSARNSRIVYVEQEPEFPEGSTVTDVVYATDSPLMNTLREYQMACDAMTADPEGQGVSKRFERAMAAMETEGAWDADAFVAQIMSRLRVDHIHAQPVDRLSGGERKRVALAAALVQKPDLLVLDEPTNHLDVEAIEWLEDLLTDKALTCLLVTHDRWFLENVCQEIVELDTGLLYRYPGSYEKFLEAKADRIRVEGMEQANAQNKLRKELEWVRRQPRARQAKSKSRVEAFHLLKGKVDNPLRAYKGSVTLESGSTRLGTTILKFEDANLAFRAKILDDFSYEFEKGDSIGIVGGNGVGKTSFLNVLTQLQPLDSGVVTVGETIRYGYYKQKGLENIPEGTRVLQLVEDVCAGVPKAADDTSTSNPQAAARQLLSRFNFPAARWNDMVTRLSGGERRRLQLLQVLAAAPNFLVLDEPTNDLDIPTLNVLEDFLLNDYKGCLFVVSHDRYFMDKIAKHLFVFEGEGVVRDFSGSFSEYLDHRRSIDKDHAAAMKEKAATASASTSSTKASSSSSSSSCGSSSSSSSINTKKKMSNKQKKEYDQLEAAIEKCGIKQAELQALLDNSHASGAEYAQMADWTKEMQKLGAEADAKTERWMELAELL